MSKDPLLDMAEADRRLFEAFQVASLGKPHDVVLSAAINMIVNVLRQAEPTRAGAENHWDDLFGRGKTILLQMHYDSVTGKRLNIFPYTQVVRMPFHDESNNRG